MFASAQSHQNQYVSKSLTCGSCVNSGNPGKEKQFTGGTYVATAFPSWPKATNGIGLSILWDDDGSIYFNLLVNDPPPWFEDSGVNSNYRSRLYVYDGVSLLGEFSSSSRFAYNSLGNYIQAYFTVANGKGVGDCAGGSLTIWDSIIPTSSYTFIIEFYPASS